MPTAPYIATQHCCSATLPRRREREPQRPHDEGETKSFCQPHQFVRGHQGKGDAYDHKSYSAEIIAEQAEPLRPHCQCGCGEKLNIPPFLLQKGKGLKSIQSYWQRHPYRKSHGLWEKRTKQLTDHSGRLSTEVFGLIYGTLLGDGSIVYPNSHSRFPRLVWTHSQQQQPWMEYKATRLACLRPSCYSTANAGYGTTSICGRTICHPDLVAVFHLVRGSGENKTVTQDWLSRITPEGLAWWYMDDGSLSLSPQGSPQIQFHTEGYSIRENHLIADWLAALGYVAKVRSYTRSRSAKRYFYISLGAQSARKLLVDLQPFSIPAMDYKFGDGRICSPRWG
jgi:hypothetical protein